MEFDLPLSVHQVFPLLSAFHGALFKCEHLGSVEHPDASSCLCVKGRLRLHGGVCRRANPRCLLIPIINFFLENSRRGSCKDGSCFLRGSGFNSQHICDDPQPSLTLVLGDQCTCLASVSSRHTKCVQTCR